MIAFGVLWSSLLILITLGHDGRRIGQMLFLSAPVLMWLAWPVRSRVWQRGRSIVVCAWAMLFVADAMLRAYLLDAYQAAPDSALVLGAAANTNVREGSEYLLMNWRSMVVWSLPVILSGWVFWRAVAHGATMPARWSRWAIAALCVLLLMSAVAYASKPWRRLHPAAFWTTWTKSILTLRVSWADQQRERAGVLARARASSPFVAHTGPATVVLVITDSINRDNMSLYGYGRPTTPRLLAQKEQIGEKMVVMRNAWSVDASTLPALRNLFSFGVPDDKEPQHLLALARAAGYKVWWMSNHDDVAVEQKHARLADVVEMVNRTPGRAGASLDGELLDCIQEALEDTSERKLIVVHLMGAHPHYRLRFPAGENPFDDKVDDVEKGLIDRGRSMWVRKFRQEYDAAMLYHDFVVAKTLDLTRTVGPAGDYRAWMYLSDHGQEVGHVSDKAGHSPSTASGYRIPMLLWRNREESSAQPGLGDRPFRADWAGWTMAELLHMKWTGESRVRNVLDPAYVWHAPTLPMQVDSFEK